MNRDNQVVPRQYVLSQELDYFSAKWSLHKAKGQSALILDPSW